MTQDFMFSCSSCSQAVKLDAKKTVVPEKDDNYTIYCQRCGEEAGCGLIVYQPLCDENVTLRVTAIMKHLEVVHSEVMFSLPNTVTTLLKSNQYIHMLGADELEAVDLHIYIPGWIRNKKFFFISDQPRGKNPEVFISCAQTLKKATECHLRIEKVISWRLIKGKLEVKLKIRNIDEEYTGWTNEYELRSMNRADIIKQYKPRQKARGDKIMQCHRCPTVKSNLIECIECAKFFCHECVRLFGNLNKSKDKGILSRLQNTCPICLGLAKCEKKCCRVTPADAERECKQEEGEAEEHEVYQDAVNMQIDDDSLDEEEVLINNKNNKNQNNKNKNNSSNNNSSSNSNNNNDNDKDGNNDNSDNGNNHNNREHITDAEYAQMAARLQELEAQLRDEVAARDIITKLFSNKQTGTENKMDEIQKQLDRQYEETRKQLDHHDTEIQANVRNLERVDRRTKSLELNTLHQNKVYSQKFDDVEKRAATQDVTNTTVVCVLQDLHRTADNLAQSTDVTNRSVRRMHQRIELHEREIDYVLDESQRHSYQLLFHKQRPPSFNYNRQQPRRRFDDSNTVPNKPRSRSSSSALLLEGSTHRHSHNNEEDEDSDNLNADYEVRQHRDKRACWDSDKFANNVSGDRRGGYRSTSPQGALSRATTNPTTNAANATTTNTSTMSAATTNVVTTNATTSSCARTSTRTADIWTAYSACGNSTNERTTNTTNTTNTTSTTTANVLRKVISSVPSVLLDQVKTNKEAPVTGTKEVDFKCKRRNEFISVQEYMRDQVELMGGTYFKNTEDLRSPLKAAIRLFTVTEKRASNGSSLFNWVQFKKFLVSQRREFVTPTKIHQEEPKDEEEEEGELKEEQGDVVGKLIDNVDGYFNLL